MQRTVNRIPAGVENEIHHHPLGEDRATLVNARIGQGRHRKDEIALLEKRSLPQSNGGGWQIHGAA